MCSAGVKFGTLLLAAAIVSDGELSPDYLRERWLTLADFSELLQSLRTPRPRSITIASTARAGSSAMLRGR